MGQRRGGQSHPLLKRYRRMQSTTRPCSDNGLRQRLWRAGVADGGRFGLSTALRNSPSTASPQSIRGPNKSEDEWYPGGNIVPANARINIYTAGWRPPPAGCVRTGTNAAMAVADGQGGQGRRGARGIGRIVAPPTGAQQKCLGCRIELAGF